MNLKDKKGSISIFVLVALLFMSGFLIISFGSNINKSKTIKEQFNVISGIYSYTNGDEGAYDKAYTDLRKKNKQIITTSVENSNTIELTKTFEDKVSNYRIYGNSIQDGTPTPDTPVEVQSVGDMTNLIKFNVYGHENNTRISNLEELKSIISQGYDVIWSIIIQSTGGIIEYGQPNTYYLVVEVEPNTEYTLSGYTKNNIFEYDENLNYIQTLGKNINSSSSSFVTSENAKYIMTYIYNRAQTTTQQPYTLEEIKNMNQLEEGTEATEYVPYGKYKIPIKVSSENLFDKNMSQIGYVDNYVRANGADASGNLWNTFTPYTGQDSRWYVTNPIKIKPNTVYNYSGFQTYNNPAYCFLGKDKSTIYNGAAIKGSGTFTTPAEAAYIIFSVSKEYVNTATIIEEPKTFNIYLNEPLRKIGDVADYIDFKTGKVVRNIEHTVLSGSNMTWSTYDDVQEDVLGFYTSDLSNHSPMARIYSLSNRFERSDDDIAHTGNLDANYETFYINVYFKIAISKERVTDLDTFKTWLEQNPTYVDYILESPVEENISLPELNTYEDYTKIEVLTETAPSKIEVEYTGYTLEGN